MKNEEINTLISEKNFPESTLKAELIETHISWVIICDEFVYKIKKPIRYSFLDFSTLEKRKFYCEREIELNKRIAYDVYLEVLPVKKNASKLFIGAAVGSVMDYAVKMRKLPQEKRMDKLLLKNEVSANDIYNLAMKIGNFHQHADVIYSDDISCMPELFNDILAQKEFIEEHLHCGNLITDAVTASDKYIEINKAFLKQRISNGFKRDCHGDLHSRNIFLVPAPQPFDCIEFNDSFRQTDVLNEIAFLCMDLDAFGRKDLSQLFFKNCNKFFPCITSQEDEMLFIYYKAYRANIRAKVNALRAKNAESEDQQKHALSETHKYILLMNNYIGEIKSSLQL